MKKIKIIVGSPAKNSLNRKLAMAIQNDYKDLADFSITEILDIPFYNYEIENNEIESVKRFREEIKEADGVIVLAPEYNGVVSAVLKNVLDWSSRGEAVLKGKPVFVTGATPSIFGTVRAQDNARYILNQRYIGAYVMPTELVAINDAYKKFDENTIFDKDTKEFLKASIINFIKYIDQLQK